MTLDQHLARYYQAAVLSLIPVSDVFREYDSDLANDASLADRARARLAELEGVDERRCFITKTHRDFLTAALGGR